MSFKQIKAELLKLDNDLCVQWQQRCDNFMLGAPSLEERLVLLDARFTNVGGSLGATLHCLTEFKQYLDGTVSGLMEQIKKLEREVDELRSMSRRGPSL